MKTMGKIDFEILRMKGFRVKFGVLKKKNLSHRNFLKKVLKFVSEKGYETVRKTNIRKNIF